MNPIGLYIHIPFCDGKCAYCDFFSIHTDDAFIEDYTEHLICSIRDWGKRIDRTVDTVYFGGGTPSLLGHQRLTSVLSAFSQSFSVSSNAEITVEVNPSSTDKLDFGLLRSGGFNRLSIGMQSVNDRELALLGRRHDTAAVVRTIQRAKAAGFDNISLDVMLAVPEQTIESLDRTLAFCADQQVKHISCYILKIEKGTRFYQIQDQLPLFSDDEQAAFYEHTVQRLREAGYAQYEISNFSLKGFESRHNLHYWRDEEYLGIGPSAHSFINSKRFYYNASFHDFYEDKIVSEGDGGGSDEYIMLALRLSEGLRLQDYKERFHRRISDQLLSAAKVLEKNGLCTVDENAVALTTKGFLISNSVIGYLLENT